MAAPESNLQSAYESVCAKIAEALADPKPNYTVDGVSIDRAAYYRMLLDTQKQLREAVLAAQGPFEFNA